MGENCWFFFAYQGLRIPRPAGTPLEGGHLPDACFCAALRRVALRVPLLRGAGGIRRPALRQTHFPQLSNAAFGGIRRPALRQTRLAQPSKMLCVNSKPRLAQLQFLLLAQPIPNQLALFLDILGNAVGILANVAVQHTHYR